MKVRLVGGPFGGQVKEVPYGSQVYGSNEIVMRGSKRMTRKQRYELFAKQNEVMPWHSRVPTVTARYKVAMRPHRNGEIVSYMPCMHPDGSLFYEFIEGSKTEL